MSAVHPSRAANIPSTPARKRKKHKHKPAPASTSLTRAQLRKKIRDTTRLLQSSSSKLSATTRIEHERALAAYEHELASQQTSSKQAALAKRYHMVRFFERRKATRALSRLQRQLDALLSGTSTRTPSTATTGKRKRPASDDDDSEEEGSEDGRSGDDAAGEQLSEEALRQRIAEAELDLAYIHHFPPLEKYISLYRSGDSTQTNEKRARIRADIAARLADGTIDSLSLAAPADAVSGKRATKKSASAKRRPAEAEEQDGDGSDGGFFEF
ncbi:18S rRNA maturation protein [Orbilia brochopaga]|uniref:rRNA-processing protein EFG1 n=1 Tax=Orbilia brochopaga TaxID=3140254 RepID=A0AAV9U1Y6_9PEZI